MCTYSMVLDTYTVKPKEWWVPVFPKEYNLSEDIIKALQKAELDRKIRELEELIQKAREYDKKNNQPDCELDEKRQALKKIADDLGVKIKFLE